MRNRESVLFAALRSALAALANATAIPTDGQGPNASAHELALAARGHGERAERLRVEAAVLETFLH